MRIVRLFQLCCLFSFPFFVAAQQPYAAATISPALREGAHAVMRAYQEAFVMTSPAEGVHRTQYVVTVLDAEGQSYARLYAVFDKMKTLTDVQAFLYDASGKQIKKLKKGELVEANYVSSGTLFDDLKYKTGEFKYANYPYTVEVITETRTRNTLFLPSWFPQRDNDLAIESATYQFTSAPDCDIRYRLVNGMPAPTVSTSGGSNVYTWTLQNRPVWKPEPYSPELVSKGPGVILSPTVFEMDGRRGQMRSWQELGAFHELLNRDRDQLPVEVEQKVKSLISSESDVRRKVQKLYEYLQANTRYISVQLGIGGWQTIEAREVADKGYGDCKALTNYMKAMLKIAGIPSYQALVSADEPDRQPDFVLSDFNHVILCVPQPRDSIWLECTSQTQPFGYLGDFTEDRYVLLLTPDGGKLIRTPTYRPADNLQVRQVRVQLKPTGEAQLNVNTRYTGIQQETHRSVMQQYNPEQQKEWLYKKLNLTGFEINRFAFKELPAVLPTLQEDIEMTMQQGASRSGNRLFMNINLLTPWRTTLSAGTPRTSPFEWPLNFQDVDTVYCTLPTGYAPEFIPQPISIKTAFGEYEAAVELKNKELFYRRRLRMNKATYGPEQYAALADFFKKISKADRTQLVLVQQ